MSKKRNNTLKVKEVWKKFGSLKVLQGLSLETKGGVEVLMGPNGSGKSTLVNIITGRLKPDSGEIIYGGKEITGTPPNKVFDKGISRTFQVPRQFSKLTVLENMLVSYPYDCGDEIMSSLFKKKWEKEEKKATRKALEILDSLELEHLRDELVSSLSGGQSKLLEIGRALMSEPDLIIADEPTSGINPTLAKEVLSRIQDICKNENLDFLMVEHRLGIAKDYVDYMYALFRGKIISEGKPDEVLSESEVVENYLEGG